MSNYHGGYDDRVTEAMRRFEEDEAMTEEEANDPARVAERIRDGR
ncbi:hypothetical protein [Streptomyces sp. JNUCC 63]